MKIILFIEYLPGTSFIYLRPRFLFGGKPQISYILNPKNKLEKRDDKGDERTQAR